MTFWHRHIAAGRQLAEKHRTKVNFVLIGGINTVFGLAAYPMLYFGLAPQKLHYLQVLAISQAICISFAFVTNKYMVFRTVGNHIKEYIKFLSFYLIYFVINLAVLPLMVEFLAMNPVLAQSFFALAVIISSYFWHSRITFKIQKKHNEAS